MRLPFQSALLVLLALAWLCPAASAQFVVTTSRDVVAPREALVIGEKFVNATLLPVQYSTLASDGTPATIQYLIERVDPENNATTRPPFQVEINGAPSIAVKSLRVHAVSSSFSGEIGPGRSNPMGGSLGFGVPFNLLRVPPATTGATFVLVTASNQELTLDPGDRLALLTTGTYQLTALIDGIQINGYRYSRMTTGFLVAETFFTVTPRSEPVGAPVRVP